MSGSLAAAPAKRAAGFFAAYKITGIDVNGALTNGKDYRNIEVIILICIVKYLSKLNIQFCMFFDSG